MCDVKVDASVTVALSALAAGAALIAFADAETAPIATLMGAVVVAAFTAIATDRRQVNALAAEAERHHERLQADRRAHDVDALRDFLDRVATAFEEMLDSVAEVVLALEDSKADIAELRHLEDVAGAAVGRGSALWRAMDVRFDPNHDIPSRYGSAVERFISAGLLIHDQIELRTIRKSAEVVEIRADMESAIQAWRECATAIRAYLGPAPLGK